MKQRSFATEPDIKALRFIDQGIEMDFVFPRRLLYFQGHFPDFPVLPGVVQIHWVVRYADRYLGTEIGAAREFRVKFRSVIEPDDLITLVIRFSKDRRRVEFEFRSGDSVSSLGSVCLEA